MSALFCLSQDAEGEEKKNAKELGGGTGHPPARSRVAAGAPGASPENPSSSEPIRRWGTSQRLRPSPSGPGFFEPRWRRPKTQALELS